MEAALKTSLMKEILVKTSPQAISDDLWVVNGQNVVACDDFFVDDLLDLSNEDGLADDNEPEEEEDKACPSVPTLKLQDQDQDLQNLNFKPSTSNFSPKEDFGTLPTSELGVPVFSLLFSLFTNKGGGGKKETFFFFFRLVFLVAVIDQKMPFLCRQTIWRTSNGYPILSTILSLNSLRCTLPEY